MADQISAEAEAEAPDRVLESLAMRQACPYCAVAPMHGCRTRRGRHPGSYLPGKRNRFHRARLTAAIDAELDAMTEDVRRATGPGGNEEGRSR